MLVVADSSPLNFLIRLGYAEALPALFENVAIPPAVAAELSDNATPSDVRAFVANPPPWLRMMAPTSIESIAGIDPGEASAISLARETKATALLIDEKDGRRAAIARGITVVGTIGVLEAAASRGLLDLKLAFEKLKLTEFRIRPGYLDDRLRLFQRE